MESLKPLIRPTRLERIYDVVKDAGIDVSAWHTGKGDYASNPNFCYRWAFEGKHTALLCLWFRTFKEIDGIWTVTGNARQEQIDREAQGSDHWDSAVRNRTKRWAKSAYQFDEVIKQVMRNKLEVRVCIVDTRNDVSELEASIADYRELDPVPWELTYDMLTGQYQVQRTGQAVSPDIQRQQIPEHEVAQDTVSAPAPSELPEISDTSYGVGVVDQFIGDRGRADPTLVERYEYERSGKVRQLVMLRSKGHCEWCGEPGFRKHDGEIYLESHHVVALSAGGVDEVTNVIALCPNDHRIAHYGEHREIMAQEMSDWLLARTSGRKG